MPSCWEVSGKPLVLSGLSAQRWTTSGAHYRRTMAITSVLDIRLPPDAPSDAEPRITAVLSATRARPGCLSVDVVRDLDDRRHLVVLEVWESLEADDAYRAWRATPAGASELRELAGGQVTLKRYEATTI